MVVAGNGILLVEEPEMFAQIIREAKIRKAREEGRAEMQRKLEEWIKQQQARGVVFKGSLPFGLETPTSLPRSGGKQDH